MPVSTLLRPAVYSRGFNPQTPGQVQTWLGRELIRPGDLPREHGRFLNDLETYRRRVEYGSGGVERETADLLEGATAFVDAMRELVENGLED